MTIAILGGYGDIGGAAVRQLLRLGLGPLRIGGRRLHEARRFAADLPGAVACQAVDFLDPDSLRTFVAGSRIVLNCAGPSHLVGDRAARAALDAGADYVDAAGDDPLHARLDHAEYVTRGRTAVLSAGLQPGLTGLLPRWTARQGFTAVHRLTSYFGLLDYFTEVAADDYLQGAADQLSEPLAAWRNGRRSGVLTRRRQVELPFFPGSATVLPYLNTEGERLAAALGLTHGDWYTVLTGTHILSAFDRARTLPRREAAALLRQASLLDLAGREAYVILVVQLEGLRDGVVQTRTAVLRGRRNAELTGAVAALATAAVAGGEVSPGCGYAADLLDPDTTMVRLQASGALCSQTLLDTPLETLALAEEGTL